MTGLLIITTLDVIGRRNNREHHAIAAYKKRFAPITVIYRKRGAPGRGVGRLLGRQTESLSRDGVSYIGVDPLLNPPDGTVRKHSQTVGRPTLPKRMLALALDTSGIARDWLTIRGLAQTADEAEIGRDTICLCFGPWAVLAARKLRQAKRVQHLVYVDRDYEPGFMSSALRRLWAVRAERRAAGQADLTLSIGQRLADRFADVPGARVRLSPTGVDRHQFVARLRTLPTPAMIFVGEVAPWSGIEEALDALSRLRRTRPDAHLTVLGPSVDSYREALSRRISGAGLADHVCMLGSQDRQAVAGAIDAAGIGLAVFRPHPLRIHAAPLKILEYMASGLPVLALEGSEAGDMVARTETGLLAVSDGAAIAAAATRMLDDPGQYARMSAAGPKIAETHDWERIFEREMELLAPGFPPGSLPSPGLSTARP